MTAFYIAMAGGVVYRHGRILFNNDIAELLITAAFGGFATRDITSVPSVILDACNDLLMNPFTTMTCGNFSLNDYLTDKDLALYALVEWVGCTWSLLMMVSSL